MANYVLDPSDQQVVSTVTDYKESVANADYVSPWNQSQSILEQYHVAMNNYMNQLNPTNDRFGVNPFVSPIRNLETGLTQYGTQMLTAMGQQYEAGSLDLRNAYINSSQNLRNSYAMGRESDIYTAKNQAAAQYATKQSQISKTIADKYAAAEQEAQQSLYSDYAKQQSSLDSSYSSAAGSFKAEADKYLAEIQKNATAEEVAYDKNLFNLVSMIFNIDPESPTWTDDMIADGWLTEDGKTTIAFDDMIGDYLYGENALANIQELEDIDEDLAEFVRQYRYRYMIDENGNRQTAWTIGQSFGLDYNPSTTTGKYTSAIAKPESQLSEGVSVVNNDGSNKYSQSESYMKTPDIDDPDAYNVTDFNEITTKAADGSTVTLAAGKAIDATDWEYVSRGKTAKLRDALNNKTFSVGSVFTGKNGKKYMVVYHRRYRTNGPLNTMVREVK